jgi:hypothetical protein
LSDHFERLWGRNPKNLETEMRTALELGRKGRISGSRQTRFKKSIEMKTNTILL